MTHILSKARLLAAAAVAAAVSFAAPHAQAATEVRLGFIPVVGSGQIFVIEGEGWARENGIDLKLTQFESGPASVRSWSRTPAASTPRWWRRVRSRK
jgi:NitT/TauT family transport system substrate-binding protein